MYKNTYLNCSADFKVGLFCAIITTYQGPAPIKKNIKFTRKSIIFVPHNQYKQKLFRFVVKNIPKYFL